MLVDLQNFCMVTVLMLKIIDHKRIEKCSVLSEKGFSMHTILKIAWKRFYLSQVCVHVQSKCLVDQYSFFRFYSMQEKNEFNLVRFLDIYSWYNLVRTLIIKFHGF